MLIARPLELRAQVVGQHLHVARQHDQVDVELVDQLEQRAPRPRPWSSGVTGMWWNGMPYGRGQRLEVAVVGDDRGDVDRAARRCCAAEEQVVEAVAEPARP